MKSWGEAVPDRRGEIVARIDGGAVNLRLGFPHPPPGGWNRPSCRRQRPFLFGTYNMGDILLGSSFVVEGVPASLDALTAYG